MLNTLFTDGLERQKERPCLAGHSGRFSRDDLKIMEQNTKELLLSCL